MLLSFLERVCTLYNNFYYIRAGVTITTKCCISETVNSSVKKPKNTSNIRKIGSYYVFGRSIVYSK